MRRSGDDRAYRIVELRQVMPDRDSRVRVIVSVPSRAGSESVETKKYLAGTLPRTLEKEARAKITWHESYLQWWLSPTK